ncbi:MAG TPA: c-type cytochrome domain-containing protein, partial [Caulobacteraceae bacterium]|nr:c-type cytochrome domain-containing protein [Caulobacteraceae bacterium]
MGWNNRVGQALFVLVACAAAAAPSGGFGAAPTALPHPAAAVLSQYCFTCHNDKRKAGGLVLQTKDLNNVGPDAETWEKVVRKLRMGAMPPPGQPRPDNQTTDSFVAALEGQLDHVAALHPNPGRTQALH